jgi:hypothetical protein
MDRWIDRWAWLLRYAVACVVVLLLSAILARSRLFQATTIGARGLTAGEIVRFLGDATALTLVWLAAARAARSLPDDRSWRSLLHHTLVPVATLVVLGVGYGVPLFVLHPFLGPAGMMAYNWLFVVALVGTAVWLVIAAYHNADALAAVATILACSLRREATGGTPPSPTARCPDCGTTLAPGAPACQKCGRARSAA